MHFLYVDESGDPGYYREGKSQNSQHYILSSLIISQEDWMTALERMKKFRDELKKNYGLGIRTEIHASELIRINKIEEYKRIKKSKRIEILNYYASQIPIIFDTSKVLNICLDKKQFKSKKDIQEVAWIRLIQRFDNYLSKTTKDKGIIISDTMNEEKLIRNTMRKMRIYNPTPSYYTNYYNNPIKHLLEDPFNRDSKHSFFIQTVDVIAQILYRREFPKGSLKKYNIDKSFEKLEPILLKEASRGDRYGIVRK